MEDGEGDGKKMGRWGGGRRLRRKGTWREREKWAGERKMRRMRKMRRTRMMGREIGGKGGSEVSGNQSMKFIHYENEKTRLLVTG